MISRLITPIVFVVLSLGLAGCKKKRDHFFMQTDFLVGAHATLYVQTHREHFTFGPGISKQGAKRLVSCRSTDPSVLEVVSCRGEELRVRAKKAGTAQLVSLAVVDGKNTKATTPITVHAKAVSHLEYPQAKWEAGVTYTVELSLRAPSGEELWLQDYWRVISGDAKITRPKQPPYGEVIGFELALGKPGTVIVESEKTGEKRTLRVEAPSPVGTNEL